MKTERSPYSQLKEEEEPDDVPVKQEMKQQIKREHSSAPTTKPQYGRRDNSNRSRSLRPASARTV